MEYEFSLDEINFMERFDKDYKISIIWSWSSRGESIKEERFYVYYLVVIVLEFYVY